MRAQPPPVPVSRGATPEGDGIVVGAGPVDVEAYIDFGCPFCKQFELMAVSALDRLLADRLISSSGTRWTSWTRSPPPCTRRAPQRTPGQPRTRDVPRVRQDPVRAPTARGWARPHRRAAGRARPGDRSHGPQFAEAIWRGTYLPWPLYVTQRATQRGVAGTPSVFVRGVAVPARPGQIQVAVKAALD